MHFKINVVSVCSRLTNLGFRHSFIIDHRKSVGTQFISTFVKIKCKSDYFQNFST
jgi:hypothetical protein